MDFTNLWQRHNDLISYLEDNGYTQNYVKRVRSAIRWILGHDKDRSWQTYTDAYNDRVSQLISEGHKRLQRVVFGAIQQFDIDGEYPNRRPMNRLIKKGAYHQLNEEFKELIDFCKNAEEQRGLKHGTIRENTSRAAVFFHAMQVKGLKSLSDITEDDVLDFFLDEKGVVSKSSSYRKQLASVFKAGVDWKEAECRRILAYLPKIRHRRKNVQFLKPEETEMIRAILDDETIELSFRDRAIGKLLFFTGIRPCDIAKMGHSSIDWETDEIYLHQQKTDAPLSLPLTAAIGNAIYDYIATERPESGDPHIFLSELYPHRPFNPGAVWHISAKIYKAAAIRQGKNDRRGTHLFRYNVATAFLGSGVSRPVISQTLGHTDPLSLDTYLNADLPHLKGCALSIEAFPVSEEVFGL
jgi:integrase